jgi:acetoin utilization deacetylase AcuC-like enzyme
MSRCGLLYDPAFLDHLTGPGHPECPDRASHAYEAIKGSGLLKQCTPIVTKECQMVDLERAHSQTYLTRAQKDILLNFYMGEIATIFLTKLNDSKVLNNFFNSRNDFEVS